MTKRNTNRAIEGHGSLRKTKAFGLAGVMALAGVFVAGNASNASADEVVASTETPVAATGTTPAPMTTETEATLATLDKPVEAATTVDTLTPAETLVDVAKNANTIEATKQADLDEGYTTVKNQADVLKVPTTEGDAKTYDNLKDASKDINDQSKAVADAAAVRDELNAKLDTVIKDAEKAGITVNLTDDVVYDKAEDATADINKQVEQLGALTETVTNAKTRLETVIKEATDAGVLFKGDAALTLVVGKEDEFNAQLAAAEKAVKDAIDAQKAVTTGFDKAVAKAGSAKVKVIVKGQTEVTPEEASKALEAVNAKVDAAVAQKAANDKAYAEALKSWEAVVAAGNAKVEAEYQRDLAAFNKRVAEAKAQNDKITAENKAIEEANKNAKGGLTKESTAKANNDGSYTQSLSGLADVKIASTGEVTLTPTGSVTLVSAELVSASGKKQALDVKDNKVSYKGALTEAGNYTVNYTFKPNGNAEGKVVGSFVVTNSSQDSTTSTKTTTAPMDLIAMVDSSPSFSSRSSQIFPIIKDILKDANPKTRLAFFDTSVNTTMSHIISNDGATRWMSLDDAKKFVDLVVANMEKTKAEGWSYYDANNMFYDVLKKHPEFLIDRSYVDKPIEKAHEDLADKNKIFNVLQVTDGWSANEEMDSSFAEYVKAHAKTFVSAIDASGAGDYTIGKMRALGFDTAIEANPVTDKDKIVSYFREVATETVNTPGEVKQSSKTDSKTDSFAASTTKPLKQLVAVPTDAPKKGKFNAPAKPVQKEAPTVELSRLVVTTASPKLGEVQAEAHKVSVSVAIHPVTYKAPEAPKAEAPVQAPVAPVKEAKVAEGRTLPNTGSVDTTAFGLAGLATLGAAGALIRRKTN
jgi:LPXTG-motif cell wall anchor domain protein